MKESTSRTCCCCCCGRPQQPAPRRRRRRQRRAEQRQRRLQLPAARHPASTASNVSLQLIVAVVALLLAVVADASARSISDHASNYAVIVSSSRYWFNYRHVVNALSIYKVLKSNGVPDSNIVLMLADEYAANPRNPLKNRMYNVRPKGGGRDDAQSYSSSLYDGTEIEIDYRGDDVSVDNFVRVLTAKPGNYGGDGDGLPVLNSDENSNVLLYLTGHGGDQFFKFQDVEEIMATDLALALKQMHRNGKYRQLLFVADTCQAFTLGDKLEELLVPNVTMIGSSLRGESSYARHADNLLGLSVVERYTHAFVEEWIAKRGLGMSLKAGMVDPYPFELQRAHVGYSDATSELKIDQLLLSDFFAAKKRERKNAKPGEQEKEEPKLLLLSPTSERHLQGTKGENNYYDLPFPSALSGKDDDGDDDRSVSCSAASEKNGQCGAAASDPTTTSATTGSVPVGDEEESGGDDDGPIGRQHRTGGMEPSDPAFVASVALFLFAAAALASRRW